MNRYKPLEKTNSVDPLPTITVDHPVPIPTATYKMLGVLVGRCFFPGSTIQSERCHPFGTKFHYF